MNRRVEKFAATSRSGPSSSFARAVPGYRMVGLTIAALMAAGGAHCLAWAAPANAEATGTVKAKTQRMSDANLSSQQDGWYNPGDKVTLVCSTRGQQVKGFFSFNIPGGWDNLWYKTSDGHFVADVDIETGTLDVVAPSCTDPQGAASAPAASSSKADAAVAKANSAVGSDMFGPLGCGKFVAWAYGVGGIGYNTAKEFRDALASQGRIHMDQNFPRGALVFSENSLDGGAGHVDIAQGDGTFISGGVEASYKGLAGAGHNVQVMNTYDPTPGHTFLGWAEAPW